MLKFSVEQSHEGAIKFYDRAKHWYAIADVIAECVEGHFLRTPTLPPKTSPKLSHRKWPQSD